MSLNTSRDTIPLLIRLGELVHKHPEVEVADANQQMVVVWCPDLAASRSLELEVCREGFKMTVRKGFNTPSYYLQIAL